MLGAFEQIEINLLARRLHNNIHHGSFFDENYSFCICFGNSGCCFEIVCNENERKKVVEALRLANDIFAKVTEEDSVVALFKVEEPTFENIRAILGLLWQKAGLRWSAQALEYDPDETPEREENEL